MDFQEELRLKQDALKELKKSTGWFAAIAAFSLINSLIWWLELINIHFLIGIQIVDRELYLALGEDGFFLAMFLSVVICGFFTLATVLSNAGVKWIYYLATGLYIIDTLATLYYGDYFSLSFHILALVFIFKGISNLNTYAALKG